MNPQLVRTLLTAVLLKCCFLASADAHAWIGLLNEGPPNCSLMVKGEIDADSAARVMELPCQSVTIMLDSPGGDLQAAMNLGRWLRARKAYAVVFTDAVCLSSCALVYIGATTRESNGIVGLHRPYLGGRPLPEEAIKEAVETMMRNLRDYVAEMNITQEFADIMQNTPPAEVRMFQGTDIQRLVPDRDFIDEELEMAGSADYYRLPVEEYRKRSGVAEARCLEAKFESPEAYYECHAPIILGIGKEEFEARRLRIYDICFKEGAAMLPHINDPHHPAMKAFDECGQDVMTGLK